MNREDYLKSIVHSLSVLSCEVKNRNSINLLDINILAEDLFKDFLNLVYRYELINFNILDNNATAIDLCDKKQRIAIQVTSQKKSSKIDETIKKFNEKKLYTEYDRLLFLIITEKQTSYKEFESGEYLNFDKDKDIVDFTDILKYIRRKKADELKILADFLCKELNKQSLENIMETIMREYSKSFDMQNNLKELCELGIERIEARINMLINFYKSSWVTNWSTNKESIDIFNKLLKELMNRENISSIRTSEIIEEIKVESKAIGISLKDYVEIEEKYIENIIRRLYHNSIIFYKREGVIFHNYFRNTISELIELHNKNINRLSKKFNTNYKIIQNDFDVKNETIRFKDIKSKEIAYEKVITELNKSIKESDWSKVFIITNKTDVDYDYLDKYDRPALSQILIMNEETENQIIEYLVAVLEVVGDSGEVFSAQICTNYIIFLCNIKYESENIIDKLKNKSNLKVIYIKE